MDGWSAMTNPMEEKPTYRELLEEAPRLTLTRALSMD
jgi:hypothetical protein